MDASSIQTAFIHDFMDVFVASMDRRNHHSETFMDMLLLTLALGFVLSKMVSYKCLLRPQNNL